MPSDHLILCFPFLLQHSIFLSIRMFSSESVLHIRWSKYWSFSISPSNEYSGLISFRIDWFDLLAVQGTLRSFLQHHNSKASILQPSAFFMVQISHLYMTIGKTIALTMWTFVGKVISLFLIYHLGLSWGKPQKDRDYSSFISLLVLICTFFFQGPMYFNFMVAVIIRSDLETKKRKSITVSTSPHLFAMK